MTGREGHLGHARTELEEINLETVIEERAGGRGGAPVKEAAGVETCAAG